MFNLKHSLLAGVVTVFCFSSMAQEGTTGVEAGVSPIIVPQERSLTDEEVALLNKAFDLGHSEGDTQQGVTYSEGVLSCFLDKYYCVMRKTTHIIKTHKNHNMQNTLKGKDFENLVKVLEETGKTSETSEPGLGRIKFIQVDCKDHSGMVNPLKDTCDLTKFYDEVD